MTIGRKSARFLPTYVLPILALSFLAVPAVGEPEPIDFAFAGYMRAATGVNSKGGKQSCFTNPGSVANEFRLGNECGIYGEASFRAIMLKPKSMLTDPFFRSQLTLAYFPANDKQYEDTDYDADRRDINVVEAYVAGGNFEGIQAQYWVGKRFYRTVDVHMNDFYYFANMSGAGAGIEKYKTSYGLWNIALLRESETVTTGASPNQTTSRVDSSVGIIGKTALDLRLDTDLSAQSTMSLWGVAAYAPPGSATTTGTSYEAGQGYVGGLYYRRKLEGSSFNDVAVVYGTGIMQSLEMSGASVATNSGGNQANRLRLVEHMTKSFGPKTAMHFAATYENRNSGAARDANSQWWNVGVRPWYALTDRVHLVAELGHSQVRDDADKNASGSPAGARQLTRITFAPEIGVKSDIFGRPVLRFFVAHSFWNDANKTFTTAGSAKSPSGLAAFLNESSGTSIGFQSEVWF